VRRPPKFSWVVDGILAAQGRPTVPGHLQYLCDNNVKYIVTLTKTRPRALLELPGVFTVFCENIFLACYYCFYFLCSFDNYNRRSNYNNDSAEVNATLVYFLLT